MAVATMLWEYSGPWVYTTVKNEQGIPISDATCMLTIMRHTDRQPIDTTEAGGFSWPVQMVWTGVPGEYARFLSSFMDVIRKRAYILQVDVDSPSAGKCLIETLARGGVHD